MTSALNPRPAFYAVIVVVTSPAMAPTRTV
jgi:hypothetical protein